MEEWACSACTFRNPASRERCEMECGATRPAGMAGGGASASGGGSNTATGWGCKRCTTVNDEAATHCAACETWRYDTANLSVLSRRQR